MWAEHRFISFDRPPIFYRRLRPAAAPNAIVLIVHGLGEHGGRYRALGEHLGALGCDVLVPDLRGHGLSGGARVHVRRFEDPLRDLEALLAMARRELRQTPLYIFGHSLGGLIAARLVLRRSAERADGLLLCSPAMGAAIAVPAWERCLARALSFLWPAFRRPNRVDTARLTHDPQERARYESDPLIDRRISARLFTEFLRNAALALRSAAEIRLPLLCLQAGEDAVVSVRATRDFYDRASSADKTLKVFDGLYHELVQERERDAVLSMIGLWISARTSRPV